MYQIRPRAGVMNRLLSLRPRLVSYPLRPHTHFAINSSYHPRHATPRSFATVADTHKPVQHRAVRTSKESTTTSASPVDVSSAAAAAYYTVALYRYPPDFFPFTMPTERDGKSHTFLPLEATSQRSLPSFSSSSVGLRQSTASTPVRQPTETDRDYDRRAANRVDEARYMLLKVSKFEMSTHASAPCVTTHSQVLSLDDSIATLLGSIQPLLQSHIATIHGVSLKAGLLRTLIAGGKRHTPLHSDASLRHLLARGSVQLHFETRPEFIRRTNGCFELNKQANINELTSASPSPSSSTPSSASSLLALPSIVLNGGDSIRIGDQSLLRAKSLLIALFGMLALTLSSHFYFSRRDQSDKIRMVEERWNAPILKQKQQEAEAREMLFGTSGAENISISGTEDATKPQ